VVLHHIEVIGTLVDHPFALPRFILISMDTQVIVTGQHMILVAMGVNPGGMGGGGGTRPPSFWSGGTNI
jgi:hypothetical protein